MPTSEARDVYLRRTYGITLHEFESILASQGGGCAGCGGVGRSRSLHVDHDHKTGIVRGILCANCNACLRKARDNSATLYALGKYLEVPPSVATLGRSQVAPAPRIRRRKRRK